MIRRYLGLCLIIPLLSCSSPSDLTTTIAFDALYPEKADYAINMTLQISTTGNLAKEIQNLSEVTYSDITCPIGDTDAYYPAEKAHFAFVATLHDLQRGTDSGQFDPRTNKFTYRLTGDFEDTTIKSTPDMYLQREKVLDLIKRKDLFSCQAVVLRYFRGPYFSNIIAIPKDAFLQALNNTPK